VTAGALQEEGYIQQEFQPAAVVPGAVPSQFTFPATSEPCDIAYC